jgi:site-specific recombinase XerD
MSEGKTIQEAITAFLRDLNSRHTSQAYATPLRHFCVYLSGQGMACDRSLVTELTVDHAIEFVPWLRHDCFPDPDRPAKATLQLYLTALYRFYRVLLKQGVAFDAADIARLEETYRDARNIRGEARPKDPKLEAVLAIIEAARAVPSVPGPKHADRQRERSRLRDIAIVETLRSTGCRVGELVSLRRADLDWMAQSALVKGKGSKYRKVYLDPVAWSALTTYLKQRQDGGDHRALERYPVFCGHGNRSGRNPSPLTTRHVARTIQRLAKRAGIAEVGVTPHYFRHVFATRALERTENLALVQDMLGHASPATTRVYAKTDEEQRRSGYARVWSQDDAEYSTEALAARGGSFEAAVSMLRAVRVVPEQEQERANRDQLLQAAVMETLWSTGCTLDELVALRLDDIGRACYNLCFVSHGEARIGYLEPRATVAVRDYIESRGDVMTHVLFCEPDGTPLSPEQILSMLSQIAKEKGIDQQLVTPGLLRGVFIFQALGKLGSQDDVRRLVGDDLSAVDRLVAV